MCSSAFAIYLVKSTDLGVSNGIADFLIEHLPDLESQFPGETPVLKSTTRGAHKTPSKPNDRSFEIKLIKEQVGGLIRF